MQDLRGVVATISGRCADRSARIACDELRRCDVLAFEGTSTVDDLAEECALE